MNFEKPDMLLSPVFQDYDAALEEITVLSRENRIIFVIDEYPYLAKAKPAISAMLQHVIDHKWKNSKLYLILCGSSMSFMENQVLGQESPLYGRRTAQFKVKPLNYREAAVYLYEEPANLLKQELREPAIYNAIIKAIAEGASHLNEIVTKVGETSGTCTNYLKTLIDLGIVKKETPITEKPGKKTIYLLADHFFRFWYRFVPANISAIDSGRIRKTYERAVKAYFPDFMGIIYEKMCQDYLLYYANELPIDLNEVGQWWGTDPKKKKQVQIDIVGTPAAGREYIIGSCKYRNERIGIDELELLREYASVFGRGIKYHYYIFSKGGFTEALLQAAADGEVTLLCLEELYL